MSPTANIPSLTHANRHAAGGSDALSPADIGADTASARDAAISSAITGSAVPTGLPSWAPTGLTRVYIPDRCGYGLGGAVLAQFRTAIGKAIAGLGSCDILAIGDSETDGYMGTTAATPADSAHSWPMRLWDRLTAAGIPSGGTGMVKFGGGATAVPDPRWTTTGTWTRTSGLFGLTGNAGDTATLTLAGGGGTVVNIVTFNQSRLFTWSISNSVGTVISTGTLARDGTTTNKVLSITGLVDAASLTITAAATNYNYLAAAEIRRPTGLTVSNFGIYGARASGTSGWEATTVTYYGPVTQAAVPNPDLVLCMLGVNDRAAGVANSTIYSALTTTLGRYPNASKLLITPWQAAAFTDAVWRPMLAGYFTLAETLSIGLLDEYTRSGGYAGMNSRGVIQDASGTHPNQAMHADLGRSLGDLLLT